MRNQDERGAIPILLAVLLAGMLSVILLCVLVAAIIGASAESASRDNSTKTTDDVAESRKMRKRTYWRSLLRSCAR